MCIWSGDLEAILDVCVHALISHGILKGCVHLHVFPSR